VNISLITGQSAMRIAALVTCYNRVAQTIQCLTGLFEAIANQNLASFEVFLVDDASPDRTGEIVKQRFPQVHVLTGTGSLFWNRGMCYAYAGARASGAFDAYMLFNDDVAFKPDALREMLPTYLQLNRTAPSVLSGPVCERATGQTTYGGMRSFGRYRPLAFELVPADGTIRECDTFNANFVLIPAEPMDAVGGLDPAYHHAYGDIDLGLMLRKRGCKTYIFPEHVGYCEYDRGELVVPPFRKRLMAIFKSKSPISDRIHFTYKRYSWPLATVLATAQIARRFLKVFGTSQDSWEH